MQRYLLLLTVLFLTLFATNTLSVAKDKVTDIESRLIKSNIQGFTIWDSGDNGDIYVVSKKNGHQRTLSFYKNDKQGRVISKYTYRTSDAFIGMFTDKDSGGSLITTWVGGSAYHVIVFDFNKDIRLSIETGSKIFPELIYDKCGNEYLLVTDIDNSTSIYQKNETSFKYHSKVGFGERFSAVTQSCQTENSRRVP